MDNNELQMRPLTCPSAPANSAQGEIFGVVSHTTGSLRVAYLAKTVTATAETLELTQPVDPTSVFRISAPCAASGCQHFDGTDCRLAQRVVKLLPAVVDRLPPCPVRSTCRWFWQEGRNACMRCPQVVTTATSAAPEIVAAATGIEPPLPGHPAD